MAASRTSCETDGTCRKLRVGFGQPCLADDDCIFGSVCEDGVCLETCASSASCEGLDEACLERNVGGASVCREVSDCGQLEGPEAFCAERLGLEPGEVSCVDGACQVQRLSRGSFCAFDQQCKEGLVCEPDPGSGDDVCTPTCQENEECTARDFKCLGRPSQVEAGKVCLYSPDPCDVYDVPDRECSRRYDEPRRCNLEANVCEFDREVRGGFRIMVEDRTMGEGCREQLLGGQAPGVDLTHLALFYGTRLTRRAYARARYYEAKNRDVINDYLSFSHINGAVPQVDVAGCRIDGEVPSQRMGSLGCGGVLVVDFYDEQGQSVQPQAGDLIGVFEFGQVCAEREGTSAAKEDLQLWWCGNGAAGQLGDCLNPLRRVSGEGGLTTWAVEHAWERFGDEP